MPSTDESTEAHDDQNRRREDVGCSRIGLITSGQRGSVSCPGQMSEI